MDKLQEIKERHNSSINSYVDGNDIDWLIEQAEKVEELQKEIERCENYLNELGFTRYWADGN